MPRIILAFIKGLSFDFDCLRTEQRKSRARAVASWRSHRNRRRRLLNKYAMPIWEDVADCLNEGMRASEHGVK